MLPPVPQGAGPSIRERSRIANPRTKGQQVHVHAPHDVAVAHKATTPTGPVASFRLFLPVAAWTAAAGSPLTAAEAHDADLGTFVLKIALVFAVFPLTHALVVMAPFVLVRNGALIPIPCKGMGLPALLVKSASQENIVSLLARSARG
jgi:hypothetical protein